DPVAVGVVAVEAAPPGDLAVVDADLVTGRPQSFGHRIEIVDPDRRMGLAGRAEVGLHAQVQPGAVPGEPAPAPYGQGFRLGDLGHGEHADVELAAEVLAVGWAGELAVVQHDESLR